MMQRQFTTIKQGQGIMSLTQVEHTDASADIRLAIQDRFTDEESAHDHSADRFVVPRSQ